MLFVYVYPLTSMKGEMTKAKFDMKGG